MEKVPKKAKTKKQLLIEQEIKLAKALAGNSKPVRDKALKSLKKWMQILFKVEKDEEDFMRIWQGLFYTLWMSDKPLAQEECADNISNLVHFGEAEVTLMFFKCGLNTLITKWSGIDQLRLDKFLMFVRRFVRQMFVYLKNNDYGLTEKFCDILSETVLDKTRSVPVGLTMHFSEVYMEEFAKVFGDAENSDSRLADCLRPFVKHLSVSNDDRVINHVAKHIFRHLFRQSDLGIEYHEKFYAWKRMGFPGRSVHDMVREEEEEETDRSQEEDDRSEEDDDISKDDDRSKIDDRSKMDDRSKDDDSEDDDSEDDNSEDDNSEDDDSKDDDWEDDDKSEEDEDGDNSEGEDDSEEHDFEDSHKRTSKRLNGKTDKEKSDKDKSTVKNDSLDARAGRVDVVLPQISFNPIVVAKLLNEFRFAPGSSSKSRRAIKKLVEEFLLMAEDIYPLGAKPPSEKNYKNKATNQLSRLMGNEIRNEKIKYEVKRNEVKMNEVKRNEVKMNEVKKNESKKNESKKNEAKKTEVKKTEARKRQRIEQEDIPKQLQKLQTKNIKLCGTFERNSGLWFVFDGEEKLMLKCGGQKKRKLPWLEEQIPSRNNPQAPFIPPEPSNKKAKIQKGEDSISPKILTSKMSTTKMSSPKMSTPKMSNPKMTSPKISTPKMSSPKMTSPKMSSPKISTPKMSSPKMTSPKMSSPKISTPKMSSPKVTTPKMSSPKIPTSKLSPFVKLETTPLSGNNLKALFPTPRTPQGIMGPPTLNMATPTSSSKKVNINLKLNRSQEVHEHLTTVKKSPAIPWDASKRPTKPLLKPFVISPINPFL